ncbi:hypothetical protein D9619_004236 [Psilocybe cf. subviscida]|uniref:VWFA domain-containing protein n=1 Tax=Psilocybe cf. subviscida TaxID=2480587 RepID=A0A8H5F7P0_9AGAR|nr:hypothetical protein D9619_004236 [Psilocybe cf. subviscida]
MVYQKETDFAPMYNDTVCTINVIKGTGLDHNGLPVATDDSGTASVGGGSGSGTTLGVSSSGVSATSGTNNTTLDLLFVQDCTASQQAYIKSATDGIIDICNRIASSGKLSPGALRVGLIGFRDYGDEYVTKSFGFTTDVSVMQSNLSTLVADGGGDYPEAVAEALDVALFSEWRVDATKMVILITDSPPHGIGAKEPLGIARRIAELGIILHLVSCEPVMNFYRYAYDFYKSLTKLTGGLVLPLIPASGLADYVIGSSLERVELDTLVARDGKTIARRVLFRSESAEDLIEEYYSKYMAEGVNVTTLTIESVYADFVESARNIETFDKAADVYSARPLVDAPDFRILPKFRGGSVLPEVTVTKKPISKEQYCRRGKFVARPSSEDPTKNSIKINIPAGWFAFVSGISRAKYNQAIKLTYTEEDVTNTEFLTLDRTREGYYVFASSEEANVALDIAFFWTKGNVKGTALCKPQYTSQKLKAVQTQTPMHYRDDFPDYVTYFILAEDQAESDQTAGVPDYNDCVGIVNLIKKTSMVFNDEA